MATLYVAKDGSDANNGSSAGLAKLTIQGAVNAATSGDTVNIYSGFYPELITATTKSVNLRGIGRVILDGSGGGNLYQYQNSVSWNCSDITFQNAGILVYGSSFTMICDFLRCNFRNSTTGINAGQASGSYSNCLFESIGTVTNVSTLPAAFTNCTFVRCGLGLTVSAGRIMNCLFFDDVNAAGHVHHQGATICDYNVYNVVDANRKIGTSSSLSAWQSASGKDTYSSVVTAPFADLASSVYHLPLNSTLARLGQSGVYIGAYPPALVLSPNVNAGAWNAPALSTGLSQDGSGYWVLNNPGSAAWQSPVIDLGGSRTLRRLLAVAAENPPGSVLDYSTADSAPRQWTLRWRGSNTSFLAADSSPAWTESSRGYDVSAAYRYVQIEYTLRTDGV